MTLSLVQRRQSLSSSAEDFVANALIKQGWQILARNFRQHSFELDIVATKGTTAIFLEVKARRRLPRDGRDLETLLPPAKKLALRRGGEFYATRFESQLRNIKTLRFDLAVVCPARPPHQNPVVQYFVDVLRH